MTLKKKTNKKKDSRAKLIVHGVDYYTLEL